MKQEIFKPAHLPHLRPISKTNEGGSHPLPPHSREVPRRPVITHVGGKRVRPNGMPVRPKKKGKRKKK